jgi:hypothetical protein
MERADQDCRDHRTEPASSRRLQCYDHCLLSSISTSEQHQRFESYITFFYLSTLPNIDFRLSIFKHSAKMKAIVHKTKYGDAKDFTSIDVPKPEASGKDVLVQ